MFKRILVVGEAMIYDWLLNILNLMHVGVYQLCFINYNLCTLKSINTHF